jgi:hypothetical protein
MNCVQPLDWVALPSAARNRQQARPEIRSRSVHGVGSPGAQVSVDLERSPQAAELVRA